MGFIFPLFDISLSQDVPFHQPQYYNAHIMDLTLSFSDNTRCQFAVVQYYFHQAVSCFLPVFSVLTVFKFLVLFFICNSSVMGKA